MHLHMKLLRAKAKPFTRQGDDVGFDIYACEDTVIEALSRKLIKVGVSTEFTPGHVGQINDRSGMGNKGITVFGGVIDPSYRGEWGVILYNSNANHYNVKAGDKIAQVIFLPVVLPEVQLVTELSETDRGIGGFGSTGR